MARKKNSTSTAEETIEETVEETTTEEVTTEETPVEEAPIAEEAVVTNTVSYRIVDPEEVPTPDMKLEVPEAPELKEGDNVKVVFIRGFNGITGTITEIRLDGFAVITGKDGTFAVPKINLLKI